MNLDDFQAELNMRTLILDQVRVASRIQIGSHLWANAKIDSYFVDSFIRDMVLQMESYVLQEKLPPETVTEEYAISTPPVPATWWDHFKVAKLEQNRWHWRWLGKLKPPLFSVKVKKVTLELDLKRYRNYPEAKVVPAQLGQPYRFANYELKPIRETDW